MKNIDFSKDYYAVLGITYSATIDEIKKSYRTLAKQHHPDKNSNSDNSSEFLNITEAYNVLSDIVSRKVYDDYIQQLHKTESAERKDWLNNIDKKHRKDINDNEYLFIKGRLQLKYWAEQKNVDYRNTLKEQDFIIKPTHAKITALSSNCYKDRDIPEELILEYNSGYSLEIPLNNPIKLIYRNVDSHVDEHFNISIQNTLVNNVTISNTTKFENYSLGELEADIYGFILLKENKKPTPKYSGKTGATKYKEEYGIKFKKYEYYYSDGSSFWSGWVNEGPIKKMSTKRTIGNVDMDPNIISKVLLVIFFLFTVILMPQILIPYIIIALFIGIVALFSYLLEILKKLVKFIFLGIALFFILVGLVNISNSTAPATFTTNYLDTIESNQSDIIDKSGNIQDQIISHYIKWYDLDSNHYEGTFSILLSDYYHSSDNHKYLSNTVRSLADMKKVYQKLSDHDSLGLKEIYQEFSRIKKSRNLDEVTFINMIVSCIQAIPYSLVLESGCEADLLNGDVFTNTILKHCPVDCCDGNKKFGVNSPVEFWYNLKGDCDTRTLLLYNILTHFKINTAILVSQYYKHSLLGVNLPNGIGSGTNIDINNKQYYLWETTSSGFKTGDIDQKYGNLRHWQVALF